MPQTQTRYIVTASIDRDGQLLDGDQPEILGNAYGQTYATADEAFAIAQDLADYRDEFGLSDVRYSVREEGDALGVTEVWVAEPDAERR